MKKMFIVDIDNTVCDSSEVIDRIMRKFDFPDLTFWRPEHSREFMNSGELKIMPGAHILPDMAKSYKAELCFLTGRDETLREMTLNWLRFNFDISNFSLLMRKSNDFLSAHECKIDMFMSKVLSYYPGYDFTFFDDDEKLLDLYSGFGLALKAPECWNVIKFWQMAI